MVFLSPSGKREWEWGKKLASEVTSELKKTPSSLLQHAPVPSTVSAGFAKAGSTFTFLLSSFLSSPSF